MVIAVIKMKALPEKCLELQQTLLALMKSTRNEKGCLGHHVFRDIEHENSFTLLHQWVDREALDNHLCSDRFAVLMGTRSLLIRPPKIMITEIPSQRHWTVVETLNELKTLRNKDGMT